MDVASSGSHSTLIEFQDITGSMEEPEGPPMDVIDKTQSLICEYDKNGIPERATTALRVSW